MAWNYTAPNQWFGGSVIAPDARYEQLPSNFRATSEQLPSNFRGGTASFKIKIAANVAFNLGMQDAYTNQHSVSFPANTTKYGLVRNGEWGVATDLAGDKIALQSMLDLFQISSDGANLPTTPFQMAIDESCGIPVGRYPRPRPHQRQADSALLSLARRRCSLQSIPPAGPTYIIPSTMVDSRICACRKVV